ncbi:hypothetical protein CYY_004823 [Polysphondylium violaceum]|uniref:TMS membrane protein n=1 Tax=Polysphondylium violaceum TaxID=133409 RepID=A0A8J4PSR4_9MYCE|nr:hypothetical protein CYY_004823 [Polysphondylium violaceum]
MSNFITSGTTACSCFGTGVKKSTLTRIVYIFFFLLVSVVAYVMSYWTFSWFNNIDVLKVCMDNDECVGTLVVFRLTFGLATYHILLALVMIGVQNTFDTRAKFQDGWWPIKILLLAGIILASFFIPNKFFVVYGWIAIFGAALFIIIQLVLLVEFAYSLNEGCVARIEEEGHYSKRWYFTLLVLTFGSVLAAIAGCVLLLVFFGKCNINQFFIVFNMAISLIIGVLSINEKVREYRPSSGLFQSGVVMLYSTYLVYSAINSEPASMCSTFANSNPRESTIIIGAVFTIISVCYSAFRASDSNELLGSDGHSHEYESLPNLDTGDEDGRLEDDECSHVTYNYTFFHITFALGAMYIGMLLTNWSTIGGVSSSTSLVSVDSGLVSVWVKMISSWLVNLLYLWTLVGPLLLPNREWH